jgi:hypothetical protein
MSAKILREAGLDVAPNATKAHALAVARAYLEAEAGQS